jgi:hypothetical protein
MFYDNMYALSGLLSHFLRENPRLAPHLCGPAEPGREPVAAVNEATLRQGLEAWLERETTVTDPTQRAVLLQLAAVYESAAPDNTGMSLVRLSSAV